ncbi:hypothetical protein [Actinoplanes sp. HUAS TT8]|uniref:hypothetical protein n=1 Tax=Actinoplanes sp. HUAS TT8 TaxID=3447453 RepID=UPI003F521213
MGDTTLGSGNGGPDPEQVQTLPEFALALNQLRGARSYKDLNRAAAASGGLPGSTVSNLLNGKSVPGPDTVATFLTACGLSIEEQRPWRAAWERVSTSHLRAPMGAVRVRLARPRVLGVHGSIRVAGAVGELPPYVPRDVDAELRTAVTAAAVTGGLVLLVGGSSVGKTRTLWEAVSAVLAEWWLLHPADAPALVAAAARPIPRTVVWLDELQRYLNHPDGLPVGVLRSLVNANTVVVATLWPDEYSSRAAPRTPGRPDPHANDRELLGLARTVTVPEKLSPEELNRATRLAADPRIRIALNTPDAGFTQVLAAGPALVSHWENAPADQCYGKAVITAALDARRVGAPAPVTRDFLTDAAPAYLTPGQQATAPADWLDRALAYATRPLHGAASALAPVPAGMGRVAGYLTADYLHQHARGARRTTALPDQVWQALVDHHHPDDAGRLAGSAEGRGRSIYAEVLYRELAASVPYALDALVGLMKRDGRGQEAVNEIRSLVERGVEHATWKLVDVLAEQGDIEAAVNIARGRVASGEPRVIWRLTRVINVLDADEAISLIRPIADAGDVYAGLVLVRLLNQQGRTEEIEAHLRRHADGGSEEHSRELVQLLGRQGRAAELRERSEAGDRNASYRLIRLLHEQGQVDELRQHADAGDESAAGLLAELLAAQGGKDELRKRSDAGDLDATYWLGRLLEQRGRSDEAITVLRGQAEATEWRSVGVTMLLARILARQGRVEEAMTILRPHAANPDAHPNDQGAARLLADLLVSQGQVDELRQRADAGDEPAEFRLGGLLAALGREDELRQRADSGDEMASYRLVERLVDDGRADEAHTMLHEPTRAGDHSASRDLVNLIAARGVTAEDVAALRDVIEFEHLNISAAVLLSDFLLKQRDVDGLRDLTGITPPGTADHRLLDLLVMEGRIGELESEVHAGTYGAASRLRQVRRQEAAD